MQMKFERIFSTGLELFKKDGAADTVLPTIKGYAAKYGEFTSLYWDEFYIRFNAGMFDEAINDAEIDCIANLEHVDPMILGRYYPAKGANSLSLKLDEVGLYFEIQPANTTRARDVIEDIKAGNILGCSCAIEVSDDRWTDYHNGKPVRDILKVKKIRDICLTVSPAVISTEVGLSKYTDGQMTKEDYLALKAASQPKTPKSYIDNKMRILGLDRK